MCFNETVSWTTLFIGSATCAFTLLKFKDMKLDSVYSKLIWYWQFTLLMQLAEALVYRSKDTDHHQVFVNLAMWLNVAQPVVGTALFFPHMNNAGRILSATITGIYTSYIILHASRFKKDVFRDNCSNIGLVWFEDRMLTTLYFLSSLVFQLCITDQNVRFISLGIFIASFSITHFMYPCSYGGVWCWSVVAAPLIAYAIVMMNKGGRLGVRRR